MLTLSLEGQALKQERFNISKIGSDAFSQTFIICDFSLLSFNQPEKKKHSYQSANHVIFKQNDALKHKTNCTFIEDHSSTETSP